VDKRIFGLRDSYSLVFAGGQRQLSPEEAWRRLFGLVVSGGQGRSVLLRNGGRLHLDVVNVTQSFAAPKCLNIRFRHKE
jgi:hypothetical protein